MTHRLPRAGWLLCVTLAGCAQAAENCSMALVSSVPMHLVMNDTKLAIPAALDQSNLTLIVDTGAERTTVDGAHIAQAELTNRRGRAGGVGGTSRAEMAMLHNVQIGALHGSLGVIAADLPGIFAAQGLAGLLGSDVLGAYDVDLDLPGGTLRFYKPIGACGSPHAVLGGPLFTVAALPRQGLDNRLFVPVDIGGQVFTALLDTGASGLLIGAQAAHRLGLTDVTTAADRGITLNGMGERAVRAKLHLLNSLTLGDLEMHNVQAAVSSEDDDPRAQVVLGMDLVKRVHLWISVSSHTLVMQFPPAASPPR